MRRSMPRLAFLALAFSPYPGLAGVPSTAGPVPFAGMARAALPSGSSLGSSYCDESVDLLLFDSGFESGDFASDGWETVGDVSLAPRAAFSGSLGANLRAGGRIERPFSTAGVSRVQLRYKARTQQMIAPHFLYVDWWDGSTWRLVERLRLGQWVERAFELPAAAGDRDGFRIRFRHFGPYAFGRAHVDDVELVQLTGHLEVFGSPSVADNDLTLRASGLPTRSVGVFLFGASAIQVPVGNGFLCVGGNPRRRLMPPVHTGTDGVATRAVDLTVEPALSAIASMAPVTTYFQLWHREHGSSNFTDARAVDFVR